NQDELAAAAESVAAKLVTLDSAGAGTLPELARATEAVVEIAAVGADAIAAIVYTSGTTGRAKGAMLSHANLASNALTLQTLWGFRADDVLLHALPVYHVHGLFVAVHCAMLAGSPMLFLSKFDALEVLAQLGKATVMMGVPTFYTRLLELADFDRAACARMRLFISGSAPLRTETWQAFFERTGHQILERYGMSEAGMITSNPLAGERLPGSVGFALPGVTVRVSGEDHQPLPGGEIGMLELTGPNVFKGYWQMPDKTAAEFSDDGFFVSGDLAVMDQSGRVRIVGRDKDLVISGGLNVYPREIEQAIDALPGVLESAVIGVPHADLGEGLVAVICAPAEMAPDEASVINALKITLAGFKIPRRVFRVDALPRNTMGKVQKNVLRETYAGAFTD
ncbi:MAG: AMP-binding protein, partial [Arenicellales bacterium]|nr:AMP-binding protein [Arenicellales bacterium]